MSMASANDPGYWSGESPDDARLRARRVLEAVRAYRAAEAAMRRRTRDSMGMGENDLLMLRYLVRAEGQGRAATPGEIARYLGITTASTTAIIDRLEKSGHVARLPHPTDRRSILIAATTDAHREVKDTLAPMHDRMYAAASSFDAAEAEVILRFLESLQDAVDGVARDDAETPAPAAPVAAPAPHSAG